MSRVFAVLGEELHEQEHLVRLAGVIGIIQPLIVEPGVYDGGGTPSLGFGVPEERAKQWLARTQAVIRQIVAADRQPPPEPQVRTHPVSKLAEHSIDPTQEHTR
jgi:hypothetical protein